MEPKAPSGWPSVALLGRNSLSVGDTNQTGDFELSPAHLNETTRKPFPAKRGRRCLNILIPDAAQKIYIYTIQRAVTSPFPLRDLLWRACLIFATTDSGRRALIRALIYGGGQLKMRRIRA